MIIRYMGAAYLIYMGVGMIFSKDRIQFEEEKKQQVRFLLFAKEFSLIC
ncbi:MAG: hypothetical protein ACI4LR_03330 [Treponema sp.]